MADIGLVPPNPKGLYDYVSYWFLTVASALSSLKSRIKIEACVGDTTAVLEHVRYGVVGHRQQPSQGGPSGLPARENGKEAAMTGLSLNDVNEYPTTYDRIHLSNIPDYIGGTLSSFLYALPLTYPDKSSFITPTCLRNPPRFDTVAQFDSEYVALSAPADLAKVFQVRMAPKEDPYEPMPMCAYNRWYHQDISTDRANLMSRNALETWLYRIFLKVAIPKDKRQIESQTLIYSPLNLTVFFRICWHLYNVGYPAHWMSGVLTEILSGNITTRARPPRSEPLSIREVKTVMPSVEQSLSPFVAELTTLAAMWQPCLPFGFLSPNVPAANIIRKYSVIFPEVPDHAGNIPNFALVFFDSHLHPTSKHCLRPFLLSDELADRSTKARAVHKAGLHVVTTGSWDRPSKTASFWLREDVIEAMIRGDGQWQVAIWRTDNWMIHSKPHSMNADTKMQKHGTWADGDSGMP